MNNQVIFHGKAGEYFGIWIVNILLSIVTLGIYSAWAKVRTKRYFYGNTEIDGHRFDYHATGGQILKGRIIVVAALVLYSVLANLAPPVALVLILIYLVLLPYLIVRGLRFSNRVTSYRNVRFDFTGTYGQAFWALIAMPILNVFTLYLMTPYVSRTIGQFVVNQSRYGDRPFLLTMPVGPLYKVFAIAMTTVLLVVGFSIVTLASTVSGWSTAEVSLALNTNPLILSALILIVPILFLSFLIYNVTVYNLQFNNTELDKRHSFRSTVQPLSYIWVALSNAVVTVFTLGLMAPWARVRLSRFLANNLVVISSGSLDEYASVVRSEVGVIGEEFMDLEGVDVGAGL